MIKQVQTAYAEFQESHNREPEKLYCSQSVYDEILEECHMSWHGDDLRYMNALVIICDDDGFRFE